MLNGVYDSVFSVTRDFKWRWTELGSDGTTRPLNFDPAVRLCRQQWAGEIIESGEIPALDSTELAERIEKRYK